MLVGARVVGGDGSRASPQVIVSAGLAGVASDEHPDPLAQLADELGRAEDPGMVAEAEHPGDQLARVGVVGDEHAAVLVGRLEAAVAAEVALDLPCDPAGDPDLGAADRLAVLPGNPVGVGARIEVGGALEVVLGLGCVADLAEDPGEAEDADRVTLVRAADDVELAALEQQLVGVDAAAAGLVALHRVVVEDDRLAPEDRGLDLRKSLRDIAAAGLARDLKSDRSFDRGIQQVRRAPGDLLQRETQRLGVGEPPIEQLQGGSERSAFVLGELDRRQLEVLGRQRVVLLLDLAVLWLLDRQHDPEFLEICAVGVEPPRERVLVHRAVSLDVAANLRRGHRPPLGHQVGDQRQLPDQFLGVLCHGTHFKAGRERPA